MSPLPVLPRVEAADHRDAPFEGGRVHPMTTGPVEAFWDLDEVEQDPGFHLPLDHAGIVSGLMPLLGIAMAFVAVMASVVP
jgi:hypothetical protein